MTDDYKSLIKQHILDEATFASATFSGRRKGQTVPWQKVSLRPIVIRQKRHLQISYFDDKQDVTKNFADDAAIAPLDELLSLPFSAINVYTTEGNIRVQITKKGKAILHRTEAAAAPPDLAHDRSKNLPLPFNQPDPFLQTIGIMTEDGRIRAKMQDKFWQINRFLQLISQSSELEQITGDPIQAIDCGCGSAHLTFATYHYLTHTLHRATHITGIDVKADLLERRAAQAEKLGWDGLTFIPSAIIDFTPPAPPDIVLALHACDTATDEALAQAVKWQSKLIFSVPCCHHHLQAQLAQTDADSAGIFSPVTRHGILKERLGDILTDSFRALILRIMGYRAEVVEFISSEHTAKNLMIRAVKSAASGESRFVQEYLSLKEFWGVTPHLETLLGDSLSPFLEDNR